MMKGVAVWLINDVYQSPSTKSRILDLQLAYGRYVAGLKDLEEREKSEFAEDRREPVLSLFSFYRVVGESLILLLFSVCMGGELTRPGD